MTANRRQQATADSLSPIKRRGRPSPMVTWQGKTYQSSELAEQRGIPKTLFNVWLSRYGVDGAMKKELGGAKIYASVAARRQAIYDIVEEQQPMTVRAVYYQAVVHGLITKDEKGYGTIKNDRTMLRKGEVDGLVMPYEWIVDNTRSIISPFGYNSVSEALEELSDNYRVNLWKDADLPRHRLP